MPLDFVNYHDKSLKAERPQKAFQNGLAAEDVASNVYREFGAECARERFRGGEGEIDLILTHENVLIFVEVKFSKTSDHGLARVDRSKAAKMQSAAYAYLAQANLPLDTEMRFDIATVDPIGRVEIFENAIWFD